MKQAQHRIAEQVRILPVVEAPCHLIEIGLQMLRRDFVPSSNNASLEQTESTLDCVGIDVPTHVNVAAVVDGFVLAAMDSGFNHGFRVGSEVVGDDHVYVCADVFLDVLRQCSALNIAGMKETQIAPTLPDANDHLFPIALSDLAVAMGLSADVGFVHLDCAVQLRRSDLLHGVPDAMAEIPRGAVVNLEHPVNLVRGHPFLGLANQIDGNEPFGQRQVRVMEDRSCRDGELVAA
jgi:hypothetical protein